MSGKEIHRRIIAFARQAQAFNRKLSDDAALRIGIGKVEELMYVPPTMQQLTEENANLRHRVMLLGTIIRTRASTGMVASKAYSRRRRAA